MAKKTKHQKRIAKAKRIRNNRKLKTKFRIGNVFAVGDNIDISKEINIKLNQYSEFWISTYVTNNGESIPFAFLVDGFMPNAANYLSCNRQEVYDLIQTGYDMHKDEIDESDCYFAIVSTNPSFCNDKYLVVFVTEEEFIQIGSTLGMRQDAMNHASMRDFKMIAGDTLNIGINTNNGIILFAA